MIELRCRTYGAMYFFFFVYKDGSPAGAFELWKGEIFVTIKTNELTKRRRCDILITHFNQHST